MLACAGAALANPVGPQVAAGSATFNSAGKTLTITNTPGTILNWQSFSIGAGELTRFQQQSALSAVLNRVTGGNPSSILGALSSNGRVFLINPHGIVFGQGAVINTAGFVASTLNMRDEDFLAGRMKFEGGGNGVLRNEGAIRASGDIFLVGPQIENAGLIKSDNGSVLLAAGQSLTISSPDAHGVQFSLQAPTDAALNIGAIEAKNAAAMFAGTLRHSGEIRATSASVDASGRVTLAAQQDVRVDGNALISVDNSSGRGGHVEITGERVGLFDNATVTARGATGGGEILVGGDYQGSNQAVRNASRSYVAPGASLDASATVNGDGGKVIVWADEVTRYYGNAAVRGGPQGGDGGLVEVSGKQALEFRGRVGLEAPQGSAGTLLLDPLNITVQAGTGTLDSHLTAPGDPTLAFGDASGVTGTLDVTELTAFTSGTVELQASNDITVSTAVTMQSGVNLKLAAINNVNVNANITTSGGGNLRLEADTDASGAGVVNLGSVTINAPLIAGDTGKEFSGKVNITGNVTFGENAEAFGKLTYGTGGLSIASGKTLTLKGGMNWATTNGISGPGTITLPSGQTLAMTTVGNHAFSNVTVNNAGTITSNIGGANLLLNDSAVLNNSGTYRFNSSDFISFNSGAGTFNNTGTLEVSGSNTATVNSVTLNNTGGTLASGTGTLNINASGNHSGALTISGSNVRLTNGTHAFADSSTIAGQLNVAGGTASFGTVTANGLVNYSTGGFNVTTGDTLTLNAGMNWATTSSISGPGTITLPSGQTLALTVGGDHALNGLTFNNNGTVTTSIGGGNVLVNNSAVVNNAGVFRLGDIISLNSGTGTFNNTGTLEVNGSGTATVSSVTLNNTGGTLNSASGTLNINTSGNHSGALTISGGNVRLTNGTHAFADSSTIAGQLNVAGGTASFGTVTANGLVNYSGGGFNVTTGDTLTLNAGMNWATTNGISGPGTITLPSGQTLAMTTAGNHAFSSVTVNNAGTITSNVGGANLLLNDSAVLNNSGTYRFNSSDFIGFNSGVGTFNNTGTLEVNGSNTATVNSVTLNNTGGTLASGSGTLNINTGGAQSGTTTISGGNVNFTAGTHAVSGTIAAGSGSSFKVGGATFNFGDGSALALADNLNFTSGAINLTGSGSGTTINAGSTLTLSSQSFGGSGKLTNKGTFNAATTTLGGVFVNEGTFNVSTGNATVSGGMTSLSGTTTVGTGRTLNVAGTGVDWQGGTLAGAGTYNLTGGLTVSGSGARVLNGPTFTINNLNLPGGSLDVQGGTLNLTGAASTTAGATLQVSGGTLTSTGTFANAGTLTKTSTGTTTLAGALTNTGTVNANAGTLHFSGGYTDSGGALALGGGSVTAPAAGLVFNTGQLRGSGTITGNLTHNGTVSVGSSPGTMTVAGNLTLGAGSILNIELGGSSQGSNYDLLQVTGTASLNGTMNVSLFGGFAGAVGNVFDVITYASSTGNFSTVNFPSGYTMSATSNPTFFQLLMSGVPASVSASAVVKAEVLKQQAAESTVLLDKFFDTVTPERAEEDEKKGTALACS